MCHDVIVRPQLSKSTTGFWTLGGFDITKGYIAGLLGIVVCHVEHWRLRCGSRRVNATNASSSPSTIRPARTWTPQDSHD